MATTRTAIAHRNAELDGAATQWNNGYLRVYDGAIVATPETAAPTPLLAELRFAASNAMGTASGGVQTAAAITQDSSADASGTPESFRALRSDGTTVICDGDVAPSGAAMTMAATNIVAGGVVQCSAFTYTLGM